MHAQTDVEASDSKRQREREGSRLDWPLYVPDVSGVATNSAAREQARLFFRELHSTLVQVSSHARLGADHDNCVDLELIRRRRNGSSNVCRSASRVGPRLCDLPLAVMGNDESDGCGIRKAASWSAHLRHLGRRSNSEGTFLVKALDSIWQLRKATM
ncbi:hypothetical protein PHSY_003036 [Pseudozyma hubeiensis SY62]|uniref:Uncharacterized protein n=1 Tax=Pseudozyma hubeiensis (strain SY62) TaxID=1305764 RepID=R9PBL1_PSEHS|nr:hypothetical protein PHSY_003036 [Pseudozyma hubeiensis SY62]GAC95460.1 hypothetical protein PHSY_003036 [Pseudozyma hubeiensis SY62]